VTLTLPQGWSSVMRGNDLVATNDGVFLQNIEVERIHVSEVKHSDGAFPLAAISSKLWPLRTVRSMSLRFAPGMSPADAAEVILASRANNGGVTEFRRQEVTLQTIAGHDGFKATFDFRLSVGQRTTPYRSTYCGFMLEDWFYGISYTAASRHYFAKDETAFEAVLQSYRLDD
jgi:hypothetical protein